MGKGHGQCLDPNPSPLFKLVPSPTFLEFSSHGPQGHKSGTLTEPPCSEGLTLGHTLATANNRKLLGDCEVRTLSERPQLLPLTFPLYGRHPSSADQSMGDRVFPPRYPTRAAIDSPFVAAPTESQ